MSDEVREALLDDVRKLIGDVEFVLMIVEPKGGLHVIGNNTSVHRISKMAWQVIENPDQFRVP